MAHFLVTGGAGFIGSNIVRRLLSLNHSVSVLDDFSTGRLHNLSDISDNIRIFRGSVTDPATLRNAFAGIDFCLHQAAIPSVPRSISDPISTNHANIDGTLSVFIAAQAANVKRLVFASSSSVYGKTDPGVALHERLTPSPISPYGVTKTAAELYAHVFSSLYRMEIVGLRYFNVFGPRQDPNSPYAAVIPRFIERIRSGNPPVIYGDGLQRRDFTYIDNVVSANIDACLYPAPLYGVYNIGCGQNTSVLDVASLIAGILRVPLTPDFQPERSGDIRDSFADISAAKQAFGYSPAIGLEQGLRHTVDWYIKNSETF